MDETYNDLYPVQLKDPEVPIQEDCTSDVVPEGTTNMEGKKKVLVPELITMTKYLFDNYRLSMYSYLNRCLRSGELSRIVGFSPLNRVFNKDSVSFSHVSYWKIDREDFFADVQVELKLETPGGHLEWHGNLVFWCEFGASFTCSIEDLTDTVEREGEYDLLSPFLVPYYSNKRMDEVAEQIWLQYIPEALTDPTKRIASELAKRMGLTIQYHPVYEHRGVDSILFFAEDDLVRGTDRMEKGDNGKKERIKDNKGYIIHIPANTIVVNTNLIHRDYSAYNIFHECVHYDQHYMFFRLQAMGSNDPRKVKVREVIVDKDQEVTDPIYFMEKQANRGAYGLMLPATDTKKVITSEYEKVENYRHIGERYEIAGKAISRQQCIPHFRIRARMIQLGFVQAKGALNYVERKLIQPFAFNLDAWREEQHTFVVDRWTTNALYRKNEEFQAVMDSGKYVYADGHVVRNDPRFVEKKGEDFFLTEWASAHVDDCCLRFVRQYVQQNVGRYVFGRMYYDADYVQQTQFYLNDLINREHLDELDAKTLYIQKFPKDFKGAIEQLKKQNKTSNSKMAEFLNSKCCKDDYPVKQVESVVWFAVKEFVRVILRLGKEVKSESGQAKAQANVRGKQLEAEIRRFQAEKLFQYELYADGNLTKEGYVRIKQKIDKDLEQAQTQFEAERLEAEKQADLNETAEYIDDLAEQYLGSHELTQQIADAFVQTVYVYNKKKVEIFFNHADEIIKMITSSEEHMNNWNKDPEEQSET